MVMLTLYVKHNTQILNIMVGIENDSDDEDDGWKDKGGEGDTIRYGDDNNDDDLE